jgi:WD40 repeat protein
MPQLTSRPLRINLAEAWQASLADAAIALGWGTHRLAAAAVSGPGLLLDGSGRTIAGLPEHGLGSTSLAWNTAGTMLATCGQDGAIEVVDSDGAIRWREATGGRWATQVLWSPVAPLVAVASDRTVRVFREDGALRRDESGHRSAVSALDWHPRRKVVAAAAYGGVTLWEIDKPVPRRFDWTGSTLALAWSPDGHYLATGDQDATVHFWFARTGQDLQMSGYQAKVRELAWSGGSRLLATGGGEQIVVWDCANRGPEGSAPRLLTGHEDLVSALAWQRDGPILASGGRDGAVILWQPGRSVKPSARWNLGAEVTALAWSRDGTGLAAGDSEGRITVLEVTR